MTANKNEKLIKEYKTIEADTAILENYSFNAARQNSAKNRYSNIHPFDHNRVVLSMDDGDTDYINASYIDVSIKVELKRKGNPVKVVLFSMTFTYSRLCKTPHRASNKKRNTLHAKVPSPRPVTTSGA